MVNISYTQHWRLRRMDRRISRSDPRLAAMLAMFARLTAGEAIASIEQAGFGRTGARYRLGQVKAAILLLVACACRASRRIARAVVRPKAARERSWLGLSRGELGPHVGGKYS